MTGLQKIIDEKPWQEMLRLTGEKNMDLLLRHLRLEEAWIDSNTEPEVFLREYFSAHQESILMLLSEDDMEALFHIWEERKLQNSSNIELKQLEYLKRLGLIGYDHRDKVVRMNQEARQALYFYMKSRSAKHLLKQYQKLEERIKGMLYVYGIMDVTSLYEQLEFEEMTKEQLLAFLYGRIEFWSFFRILADKRKTEYYIESADVKDRNHIFFQRLEEEWEEYQYISEEEACKISRMNGIGKWQGTKEMLVFLIDRIYHDVSPSVVMIKQILGDIQNGASMEELHEKLERKMEDLTPDQLEEFNMNLEKMYWHTPLFGQKGHTRWEGNQYGFSIIQGGKHE